MIICGLFYDLLFAGIPYLDPTPEMSARYAFHSDIAAAIYTMGFGGLLVGIFGGVAKFLVRHRKTVESMD